MGGGGECGKIHRVAGLLPPLGRHMRRGEGKGKSEGKVREKGEGKGRG